MEIPKINSNLFKWSGFHETLEKAQKHLDEKAKRIAIIENKLIVSAKMELIDKKCHNLFLYKFTVTTNNKDEK